MQQAAGGRQQAARDAPKSSARIPNGPIRGSEGTPHGASGVGTLLCRLPPAVCCLLRWLHSSRGDMVWNALVLITVLLPLASLTIDVPRYYVLRSRLQLAADATAEMTAQCVDFPHFQNTGETRLDAVCWWSQARNLFAATVQPLETKGYQPRLDILSVDEGNDTVRVGASGSTRLFFGMTPAVRVQVTAQSRFRMEMR